MNKTIRTGCQRVQVSLCFLLCVLFLLFIAGPGGVFAEEASDEAGRLTSLVDKVIDAYGGREAIEGMHSLHLRGKIEAFMLHDRGTYELWFRRERKLRVETKYQHAWEVRILNGERGYRSSDSLPLEEVFGPRYFAMVYQYKHLDILHDLLKGTYQIRSAGRSSLNGNDVEVLRLKDSEGTVMDIVVEARTFHIVKVTGYFSAEGKKTELSAEFSDFRKVGALQFPFRVTNYAAGMKIAETVIDEYSLNPEIVDSLFGPQAIHSL
ncbi:MAG TPA: hypothetical protein VMH06_00650 [Thermodesulfovibrionales bacterium]|nr:hypothetical protein [Thermodesulfovibrionales bacterium]